MVNIRTLQQTGGKSGSSFLVILPKDWVVRQKLSKGDPVVIAEREDGCLIIDPRLPKAGETRSTTTKIENNLRWEITSRYLLGFDEIRIVSEKPITNEQRNELKRLIKRFVALEVTEEDDYQKVKDLALGYEQSPNCSEVPSRPNNTSCKYCDETDESDYITDDRGCFECIL